MTSEPAPVEVTNHEPIPVAMADTAQQTTARTVAAKAGVDAEMLRTEDQRRISGIWERTQQVIALSVVLTSLFVSAYLAIQPGGNSAYVFLASVANLVIGFYFGRTNHQRVGGSGPFEGR
jgi:hypothetical protein